MVNFEALRVIDIHPHFEHDNIIADLDHEMQLMTDAGFETGKQSKLAQYTQQNNRQALLDMVNPEWLYYYNRLLADCRDEKRLYSIDSNYRDAVYRLSRLYYVRELRNRFRSELLDWRTVIIRLPELAPDLWEVDRDWLVKYEYIKE